MKYLNLLILFSYSLFPFANAQDESAKVQEIAQATEEASKGVAETSELDKELSVASFGVSSILTESPMDSFYRMPPSQFYIKYLDEIHRGESFRYLPILTDIVKNDGDEYAFECTLSLFKDGFGGGTVLMENKRIEGVMENKKNVLFFPVDMFLEFSDTDDFGLYNIFFEVKDLKEGTTVKSKAQILLTDWELPPVELTKDEINSFVFRYNFDYDKEAFYSSFFSKGLDFYKKGGYNGFDAMLISFYKTVFADNAFLYNKLQEEFLKMSEADRNRTIMINAFMQKPRFAKKNISSQELIYQSYIFGEFSFDFKPYEGELLSPVDMEVLWGEFFARGNYRPIERILQAYEYKAQAEYTMKVFRKELPEPNTKQQETALLKGRMYILVDNYIKSYIASPILQRYLLWTLENTASANIKEALSVIINPSSK
ncbi:MAG: hypothetical protein R3Y46_04690 [Opitutales bacterium]